MKGYMIVICALNGAAMVAGIALDLSGVIIAGNSMAFGWCLIAAIHK